MPPDAQPSDEVPRRDVAQAGRYGEIAKRYGELLSLADLAEVLRYPSVPAVRQARLRGSLAVHTQQIRGRKGWFATAKAVARYLEVLDTSSANGRSGHEDVALSDSKKSTGS